MYNNKKNIFITLSISLILGLSVLFYFTQDSNKAPDQISSQSSNQISRFPAAIDNKKKKVLSSIQRVKPELKEKLKIKFEKNFPDKDQLENWGVTPMRDHVRYKNHPYKNFHHVKISFEYQKKYGSFEALVDPRNGSILRTWNQTRYEFKKPATFTLQGHEYKE